MAQLAVFVDSYDKNCDLWENFFSIMDYYWGDCCFPRYLVTNHMDYNDHSVMSIRVGDNQQWVYCTLEALKRVKEEYVFFMFEDYYFSKKINNDDFISIIATMEQTNTFFYRLSLINGLDKSKSCVQISDKFPYAISLQPAIWRRETLISYLNIMNKNNITTPWQFEFYFIDLQNNKELPSDNGYTKGVLYDTRDLMGYKNAVIQGKWVRKVINYYKKNTDIVLTLGDRKMMPVSDELWDYIKQVGHRFIPYEEREHIKSGLKKLNIKFMR